MMRKSLLLGLAGIAVLMGCSNQPATPTSDAKSVAAKQSTAEGEHGHKPSAHGGILVSIGRDNYHAEAVFEKGGVLRLYMLGQDESKVQEVESQSLTAYVKAEGDNDAVSVTMKPEPQPGDKSGMTSLFLVDLPKEMRGKRLEVTVPSLRIAGERFRLAFKSNPPTEGGDHGMPAGMTESEEYKTFFTPGGKYTEADVKANGKLVASEKFKGIKAQHDLKPNPGDKLCPISMTKANPKFSWIIDGKTYEFCCPPCVQEFVALAKEKPGEIKDPGSYRQK